MAADGNLSTQEAEKGGYTRLDYIISSSPAWVIQREIPSFKWKRKYKNKKKIVRVMLLQLTWEEMVLITNF